MIDKQAPEFTAEAFHEEQIKQVSLKDYRGKWVVLFFYPADFTFVCPTELGELADHYETFKKLNTEVLSVSVDTVYVHKAWHDESHIIKNVQFPMLSDPTHNICNLYGTLIEKEGLSQRATFIINPEGIVKAYEFHNNDIGRNVQELIRKIEAAQFVEKHRRSMSCKLEARKQDIETGARTGGKNMKRLILLLFFILFIPNIVYASEDCPLGLINDTAPGSCVLYIDKNTDNLCDLSQPGLPDACDTNITAGDLDSTQIKSMTVKQVAEYYGINENDFAEKISELAGIKVKTSDSFQILHDNYGVRPVNVREVATALRNDVQVVVTQQEKTTSIYKSLSIAIITVTLYLISWLLSYLKKIPVYIHRKIWNWLLLIAFIPVFLTSLFWLLRVDYGIIVNFPLNITFWHVEFGIVMVLISLFHIIWHTRYYLKK